MKYLLEKYGRSEMKGFLYIAYIIENYDYPLDDMTNICNDVAKQYNVTAGSVERAIRHYIQDVLKINKANKTFISDLILEMELNSDKA